MRWLCVLLLLMAVFWPLSSVAGRQTCADSNLLRNPSNDDPLIAGEIPYWRETVGTLWTQRSADPLPLDGTAYFFAGVGAIAELQQDVDVSNFASAIDNGLQSFTFSGYVRAWPQTPSDSSRIIVEYRDAANAAVLATGDTGDISQVGQWRQVTDTKIAPSGTRFIRVRLLSTRNNGDNNDGYFDALSLCTGGQTQRLFLPFIQR